MQQVDRPFRIRLRFRSGPLAVRDALAQILSELQSRGLQSEDLGTIEIVLAEALNNVAEHAYPANGLAGPIDVDCRTEADSLHVRIIDDGETMPGGQIPDTSPANLDRDLSDLPEGGFGWCLIRLLAQDVAYRRHKDRNILDLRLPVSQST